MNVPFSTLLSTIGLQCSNCNKAYGEAKPIIIDDCKNRVCETCMRYFAAFKQHPSPCPGCKSFVLSHSITYKPDEEMSGHVQKAYELWKDLQSTQAVTAATPAKPAVPVSAVSCTAPADCNFKALCSYEEAMKKLNLTGDYIEKQKRDKPSNCLVLLDKKSEDFLGFGIISSINNSIWEVDNFRCPNPENFVPFVQAILCHMRKLSYISQGDSLTIQIPNKEKELTSKAFEFALQSGLLYTLTNDNDRYCTKFKILPCGRDKSVKPAVVESDSVKIETHKYFADIRVKMEKTMETLGLPSLIKMYFKGRDAEFVRLFGQSPENFTMLGVDGKACGFAYTTENDGAYTIEELVIDTAYSDHAELLLARLLTALCNRAEEGEHNEPWSIRCSIGQTPLSACLALGLRNAALAKKLVVRLQKNDICETLLISA